MRSIKKWARPFALVAAVGLLGMTQIGCVQEICEDICQEACDQDERACGEVLDDCLDACSEAIF